MPSATYTLGPFTAVAQTPIQAAVAGTPSGSGAQAFFSGLWNFGGGNILLRYSDTSDDATIDVIDQSHYRHSTSSDEGHTFPSNKNYRIPMLRTSNDPLVMTYPSGAMAPHGFPAGTAPIRGRLVGGCYALVPVLPDLRSVTCPYTVITNGGQECASEGNIVITGIPRDVRIIDGSKGPLGRSNYWCFWYGDVVPLTATHWISIFEAVHGVESVFTCYCIETFDAGYNWTVVGTVIDSSSPGVTSEGYSEPTIALDNDGTTFVVISRNGTTHFGRSKSTDVGRTWSNTSTITPGGKAPKLSRLTSGDWMLSGGGSGHHYLSLDSDLKNGLFANSLDLTVHHDAMISDPTLQFAGGTRTPSCYGTPLELSPGRILQSYDISTSPQRVYVVEMTISR